MKIDVAREILEDQAEDIAWLFKKEKIIRRELESRARKFLIPRNILAVMGVRRSGKSVFSLMLCSTCRSLYINFDDERLFGARASDLNDLLKAGYSMYEDFEFVILDEPQNVPGWELFANRLRRKFGVIVTGSNSRLLSGELATHLTGRYIDVEMFPFSFREYLKYRGIETGHSTRETARVMNAAEDYLLYGGFPERLRIGTETVKKIYEDIIYKDCITRCRVKNADTFRNFARFVILNHSNEIHIRSLSRAFEISVNTARSWISCLEGSYLIQFIDRYTTKTKQRRGIRKVYAVDTGIANSIKSRRHLVKGRLLENLVFLELRRKNCEVSRWKSPQGYEVDFVLLEGNRVKQLIQVSYEMEDEKTRKREERALVKAGRELACSNLLILTWDEEQVVERDGKRIVYLPVWKWLLNQNLNI